MVSETDPTDEHGGIDEFRTKVQNSLEPLRDLSRRRIGSLARTYGVSITVTTGAFATPVAAQGVNAADSVMCGGNGGPDLGRIITIILGLLAMYFIVKAIIQTMAAFDKMNSPREQEHYEGQKQLKSAGSTAGAALVPVLAGPLLDVMGINTISCLDFNIGIVGMAVPLLF